MICAKMSELLHKCISSHIEAFVVVVAQAPAERMNATSFHLTIGGVRRDPVGAGGKVEHTALAIEALLELVESGLDLGGVISTAVADSAKVRLDIPPVVKGRVVDVSCGWISARMKRRELYALTAMVQCEKERRLRTRESDNDQAEESEPYERSGGTGHGAGR